MYTQTLLSVVAAASTVVVAAPQVPSRLQIRADSKCTIVFDGRVPVNTAPTFFDTYATDTIFNPDYVKGSDLKWSDILKFPNDSSRFRRHKVHRCRGHHIRQVDFPGAEWVPTSRSAISQRRERRRWRQRRQNAALERQAGSCQAIESHARVPECMARVGRLQRRPDTIPDRVAYREEHCGQEQFQDPGP